MEMVEKPYDTEAVLQQLLAEHPSLLGGDQLAGAAPRRWLLVTREASIPLEGSTARGYLDHLFLDQDGVPTLIEVKRSSDMRIRREVVGQMLDYAANGLVYWTVDLLREMLESTCRASGASPADALQAVIDPDAGEDGFWESVKTNLQAGRVRLVFVADVIPPELRRIIEFLNGQMDPAEVMGVEVRQYVGGDVTTLVPRVVGMTAKAEQTKGTTVRGPQWTEADVFRVLAEKHGPEIADVAQRLVGEFRHRGLHITGGRGKTDGSLIVALDHGWERHWLMATSTYYGKIGIYFQWMLARPPFDNEALRIELLSRLNAIPGVNLPQDAITRRPSIPLATLADPEAFARFLAAVDWMIERFQTAPSSAAGPDSPEVP